MRGVLHLVAQPILVEILLVMRLLTVEVSLLEGFELQVLLLSLQRGSDLSKVL